MTAAFPPSLPGPSSKTEAGPVIAVTELDALATPFEWRGAVDVMLDDLHVLPAEVVSASAAERSVHRAAMAPRRSGGGRPVLVVDNSAIARKFLMQRLESLGFRAQGAESGEQALAMIRAQRFTIVFLELVLAPADDIDGLGLCQAIKRSPEALQGSAPAVVMVTGSSGSSDRVRGSLAGCDAYLTKPLTETTFVAAIAEIEPLFK